MRALDRAGTGVSLLAREECRIGSFPAPMPSSKSGVDEGFCGNLAHYCISHTVAKDILDMTEDPVRVQKMRRYGSILMARRSLSPELTNPVRPMNEHNTEIACGDLRHSGKKIQLGKRLAHRIYWPLHGIAPSKCSTALASPGDRYTLSTSNRTGGVCSSCRT
jgi:hypothetical protein